MQWIHKQQVRQIYNVELSLLQREWLNIPMYNAGLTPMSPGYQVDINQKLVLGTIVVLD